MKQNDSRTQRQGRTEAGKDLCIVQGRTEAGEESRIGQGLTKAWEEARIAQGRTKAGEDSCTEQAGMGKKKRLTAREIAVFAMLGAVMYASKLIMEVLPNIHLLGTFIVAFTVVYRKKALYPIYTYIILNGIFSGFAAWWIPYLYVWTVLWGAVMLLPEHMPRKLKPIVYMSVCAAHGFLFGTLYAPAQAILYGLNFQGMTAWIVAGLPWDFIHGVSNFFCGILIVPIISLLRFAEGHAQL